MAMDNMYRKFHELLDMWFLRYMRQICGQILRYVDRIDVQTRRSQYFTPSRTMAMQLHVKLL